MKILISAYACEPDKGSEPGVGWNWVNQICRFADEVWVITRANNKYVIEKTLEEKPLRNVKWIYFDLPNWARLWKKGQRGIHLYYYIWQIGIYHVARRLHREVGFDIVHHVTFVNYWMPSFLVLLNIPFIWGPVGGGESAPRNFYKSFSFRGRINEHLRDLARWLGNHETFTRITAKKASLALATTSETAVRLKKLGANRVEILSQVALPNEEIKLLGNLPSRDVNPFRIISLGRLLHWKGFHISLQAFASFVLDFPESEYWLIGDGPERRNLEKLAKRFKVADRVHFFGSLSRSEVLRKLAKCNVLIHPSLHDSGGLVCVEAMAAGRPVICLDLGGPALQVTEETGFKIPAHSPEQVVVEMAEAMRKLAIDEALRKRMSEAARRRVKEAFSWDRRGEKIAEFYNEVLVSWQTN